MGKGNWRKTCSIFKRNYSKDKDVRFGPINYERDPEIEAKWTYDSAFMRMYEIAPARLMLVAMVKKQYEKLEKEIEESMWKI